MDHLSFAAVVAAAAAVAVAAAVAAAAAAAAAAIELTGVAQLGTCLNIHNISVVVFVYSSDCGSDLKWCFESQHSICNRYKTNCCCTMISSEK